MLDYRFHGPVARIVLVVGLIVFVNWALSGVGYGLTDANIALLLFAFFLVASAAASLWQTRERLAVVTSVSQVSRWNLLIVVIALVNAFTQTSGTGPIHSFFWSTVGHGSFCAWKYVDSSREADRKFARSSRPNRA